MIRHLIALLWLVGCAGPPPEALCNDLCAELVGTCGYAAYPDYASCEQGCAFDAAAGAELHTLHTCVLDAACDTPDVLTCARVHGGAP